MSEQTPQEPTAPEAGITINDIHAATQIIDAATRRGAFGAAEASSVGVVYEKLVAFLRTAAPELFSETPAAEEESANE